MPIARRVGLLLSAAMAAVLVTGCGGGSSGRTSTRINTSAVTAPTTAAASRTATPDTKARTRPSLLAFAKCMRAHGVPNFPDPKPRVDVPPTRTIQPAPSGGFTANPNSPAYQTASNDCRTLADATPVTRAVARQVIAAQLKYAVCMRGNGVPNYPDPTGNGELGNDGAINGVNQSSPAFQAAEKACSSFLSPPPGLSVAGPGPTS